MPPKPGAKPVADPKRVAGLRKLTMLSLTCTVPTWFYGSYLFVKDPKSGLAEIFGRVDSSTDLSQDRSASSSKKCLSWNPETVHLIQSFGALMMQRVA
eukprot:3753683-Rhodomonas_salina.4